MVTVAVFGSPTASSVSSGAATTASGAVPGLATAPGQVSGITTSPTTASSNPVLASAKALLQLAPLNGSGRRVSDSSVKSEGLRTKDSDLEMEIVTRDEFVQRSRASPSVYDPVQLLSISKNLQHMYDKEDLKYPVEDMFLVGYTVLANEPYAVFRDVHRDLMDHLNSCSAGSAISDFKVGLVYTVLAVGALSVPAKGFDNEEVATAFINRAWNILVDKLIPKHTSLIYQSEILKNLYVLTYTYLRFFNNDLMVPYLEDSAHIILQNLSGSPNTTAHDVVSLNLDLFWSIYVLVSKYKNNEAPPKFYLWFLQQQVGDQAVTLAQHMANYGKFVHPVEDAFLNEIIVCTLANEVNNLIFNQVLWIFDLRNSLHNAIILVNKLIKKTPAVSTHSDIFDIYKKKLVVNAPAKFKDLLEYYVFKVCAPYHSSLLLLTLREFNCGFNFHLFMKENMSSPFQQFGTSLLVFFASDLPARTADINNNLGIVSFPLIFNYSLLRLAHVPSAFDVLDWNVVDLAGLNSLILEWYITVVKILINLVSAPADVERTVSNNYVLQCLMYMINENNANFAIGLPEFYLLLFHELTKVCDVWLNFVNQASYMAGFRANLNRFLNDLFVLALNNDRLPMSDLYVTNESILIKSRRSQSISSLEMASSTSTTFPPLSMAPKLNSNYVLMNKSPRQPNLASKSPGAPLAPLQGVTKLQFSAPSRLMPAPGNGLVLPPIYSAKEQGKHFPFE